MAEDGGVRIHCEVCEASRPFQIEKLATDDLNPGKPAWGDIVCTECHFVIATITAPEPGSYRIVRVGD